MRILRLPFGAATSRLMGSALVDLTHYIIWRAATYGCPSQTICTSVKRSFVHLESPVYGHCTCASTFSLYSGPGQRKAI